MERTKVFEAIDHEADYQDVKWGSDKQQSLPGFLLIMKRELEVVTVGVRCLEYYGTEGCARSTFDVTEAERLEAKRQASERRFGAR